MWGWTWEVVRVAVLPRLRRNVTLTVSSSGPVAVSHTLAWYQVGWGHVWRSPGLEPVVNPVHHERIHTSTCWTWAAPHVNSLANGYSGTLDFYPSVGGGSLLSSNSSIILEIRGLRRALKVKPRQTWVVVHPAKQFFNVVFAAQMCFWVCRYSVHSGTAHSRDMEGVYDSKFVDLVHSHRAANTTMWIRMQSITLSLTTLVKLR